MQTLLMLAIVPIDFAGRGSISASIASMIVQLSRIIHQVEGDRLWRFGG